VVVNSSLGEAGYAMTVFAYTSDHLFVDQEFPISANPKRKITIKIAIVIFSMGPGYLIATSRLGILILITYLFVIVGKLVAFRSAID
jgi:hypothetical protein